MQSRRSLVLYYAVLALTFLAGAASLTRAQIVSGNISGTVADKTGAMVANARVVATNVDTGFSKTVSDD